MAEIRVIAHNLVIERGRKNKPKSVPANERFRRNCKTMVEDEVHFINDWTTQKWIPMHILSTSLKLQIQ